MTPKTKAESPPEIVATLKALEDQTDTCYQSLRLLRRGWNFATWLSLTECIRRIESLIAPTQYGTGLHQAALVNLGKAAAQMCKFTHLYSKQTLVSPSAFRWTLRTADECAEAFEVAYQYSMFCVDFPAWHANLYAAELLNATTIRFHSGTTELGRRVLAYQKGIRPASFVSEKADRPEIGSPYLNELISKILQASSKRGLYGVKFGNNIEKARVHLQDVYEQRLSERFRRYPNISVGDYTLAEFRSFYVSLLAIVSIHEYLCFLWSRSHTLPLDSCVMVYPRTKWIQLISRYSGAPSSLTERIIPDLTFDAHKPLDLQLVPFVPLATDNSLLAVAPAFPLGSNWEENILRTCSYRRPKVYSQTSLTKEDEMREQLKARIGGARKVSGPWKLLKGMPDLDLVIEDESTSSLIVVELKWPRKPNHAREICDRNAEIRKGISQIKAIKLYLNANLSFLADRRYTQRPMSSYQTIQFCVVARDHILAGEDSEFPVYGYDAFLSLMSGQMDTPAAIEFLNSMAWLPKEGHDYNISWVPYTAGGITVIGEMYIPVQVKSVLKHD